MKELKKFIRLLLFVLFVVVLLDYIIQMEVNSELRQQLKESKETSLNRLELAIDLSEICEMFQSSKNEKEKYFINSKKIVE
jgi:hypothetical protein